MAKRGRKATGTVRILQGDHGPQWHAKFTRSDGSRTEWKALSPAIPLDDRPAAKAEAARLAGKVKARPVLTSSKIETVETYAGRWLADREGRIASIEADRARMRMHVLVKLGPLDVRTFTRDDVEALRDDLDAKIVKGELAWKTVASCWTLVTSMCSDMVSAKRREFRVRQENPCRDVKPPEHGDKKAKQYLYPSEFLQFVSCERVPLRLRRAAAIAIYTFVRDGELRELRWDGGDFDLEHGTLSVTRAVTRTGVVKSTKSGETRRFAVEANILSLLETMKKEAGGKGHVVTFKDRHMSRDLRLWLTRAGVTRPELHKGDAHRKPLTWHDLRATGLTWLAVRGDDPLKIKQRAGHSTFSTTEGYIREAEAVRDGFGEVFPTLPGGALNIAPKSPRTIFGSGSSGNEGENGGGAGNRTRGPIEADPLENKADRDGTPELKSAPLATPHDVSPQPATSSGRIAGPTDQELESAIVQAVLAGATDVARTLAAQLDDRRRARAGNVIDFKKPRKT